MSAAWDWLSGPGAASLTLALVHFVWLGALWVAVGWTLVQGGLATTPASRYAVWLGVLLGMAVTPVVTFVWFQRRAHERPADDSLVSPQPSGTALFQADVPPEPTPLEHSTAIDPEFPLPGAARVSDWPVNWFATGRARWGIRTVEAGLRRWQPQLLLCWLLGVSVSSLRLFGGALWVMQVTRQLQPCPAEWTKRANFLAAELGLRKLPRLGLSSAALEPMAARLWRPVVVLPASWLSDMPPELLEAVLAHELAHIRRHDLWVNLLQRVIEAALFFHPGVWWVSRRIRQERELCCDALAVRATGSVVDYARALEWVATWRLASASPLLGTGLGGTRMMLLQRVKRILGFEPAESSGGWMWGVAGLGALAACGMATIVWTAPVQGEDEAASAVNAGNGVLAVFGEEDAFGDEQVAQREDGDRPPPRRPGEPPREGDRRGEGPRAEERRPEGPPPPREGERRPEGRDRPEGRPPQGDRRPEGERGPDRPRPPERDRGPEGPARREGERRPDGPPPREGGPFPPFGPRGDGEFRGPPIEVMRDLMQAIQELREEVRRLRAEVEELRAQRRPGPPFPREGGPRPEFRDGPPRDGDPEFRRPDGEPRPPREAGPGPRPPREAERGPRPDGPPRGREDGRGREDERGREEGRPRRPTEPDREDRAPGSAEAK